MPEFTGRLIDPRWTPCNERMPDDEQMVLACWSGPSCVLGMESLTYHAADAPDGAEAWRDAWGETRDPPTHWMPLPPWPSLNQVPSTEREGNARLHGEGNAGRDSEP